MRLIFRYRSPDAGSDPIVGSPPPAGMPGPGLSAVEQASQAARAAIADKGTAMPAPAIGQPRTEGGQFAQKTIREVGTQVPDPRNEALEGPAPAAEADSGAPGDGQAAPEADPAADGETPPEAGAD